MIIDLIQLILAAVSLVVMSPIIIPIHLFAWCSNKILLRIYKHSVDVNGELIINNKSTVMDWVIQNCEKNSVRYSEFRTFRFKNQEDAVAFKLRWSGEE